MVVFAEEIQSVRINTTLTICITQAEAELRTGVNEGAGRVSCSTIGNGCSFQPKAEWMLVNEECKLEKANYVLHWQTIIRKQEISKVLHFKVITKVIWSHTNRVSSWRRF